MQKRISQREIARLANVRQETVSAVLNPNSRGNTRVSAESRERILRIAAEHNYRPNLQARILRGDSGSNLIGVLINARISQFFYDLLLPLEVELRKRHRRMIIGQLGNDAAEAESVLQNFIDYNLDGVIVLHHDISDGRRLFNHYLPLLPETVFLEVPPGVSGAAAVSIDFANGVREAVAHLAAGGRRRIALCMNDLRFLPMQMRLEGYRRGLEEAGDDDGRGQRRGRRAASGQPGGVNVLGVVGGQLVAMNSAKLRSATYIQGALVPVGGKNRD